RRGRARPVAALVVLAAVAVAGYPFVSDLGDGAKAGKRMLDALAPVMTSEQAAQLQADFVDLVGAVGELATTFRAVSAATPPAADLDTLVEQWPAISADLAELTGTIIDNLDDYQDLDDLDAMARSVGASGFSALPWMLVGAGVVGIGCAVAAWPRRGKEI